MRSYELYFSFFARLQMDIREALLAEHSLPQTMRIVAYVDGVAERFGKLMRLFLSDTYRVSQRASWAVTYCAELHPELKKPYFGKLFRQLERDYVHVTVHRNVVRMRQFIEIPKRYYGRVFDMCYDLVDEAAQPVAVKHLL